MMLKINYWIKKQIKKQHGGYKHTFQKYENISAHNEKIYFKVFPVVSSAWWNHEYSFFLNWRIITIQYCVGFCHTST